ncbi:unnamed protein product [Victoria cruziana]
MVESVWRWEVRQGRGWRMSGEGRSGRGES